jgi:2-phosphosulfolactate phosphatase
MTWKVHDLFHGMPPAACAGGIAVVIDVLRASTTIITALSHGAGRVLPVRTIGEARRLAAAGALLGGERGGRPIEGFDLGNSPREYSRERVARRPIVITTTNGTAALHACSSAAEVLVGAVVNRSAVAARARQLAAERDCDVHLVCAGTDGEVTAEDVLGAGAILDAASRLHGGPAIRLDEPAGAALADFRAVVGGGENAATALACVFATSLGGRNLIDIGMEADLAPAAAVDALPVVPRLDRASGWLVAEPTRPA